MSIVVRAIALVTGLCLLAATAQAQDVTRSRSAASQIDQQRTSDNSGPDERLRQPEPDDYPSPSYEPDEIKQSDPATGKDDDARAHRRNDGRDERQDPPRRPRAKPSEFEDFVSELAGRKVRRFGSELLLPEARDFAVPSTTAIPPDYRINPGDELVVGLTGAVQASDLRLTVDPDGRIFIPRIGAVRVGGVAYRDLQGAIASQVSRQYRDFRISVAIGGLHGLTVYVTGFAAQPGSYTVNSVATVVNAVLAAGGPSAGGSFRSIQVRRSGKLVADFDLYDFLLKGDKRGDIVLENGDVIYIAPAGAQVAAIGSVNKEAIYEARADDTLYGVLLYAGGANTVADLTRLHVLNPADEIGWQQISPQEALNRKAERGEILRVLSNVGIAQPIQRLQSLVTISGEVAKPGRYFVKPGTTLDEVVALAGGLTRDAYPYGSVFVRDGLRRQQEVNFEKAIDELKVSLTAQPLVTANSGESDMAFRLTAVNSLVEQMQQRRIDGRLVMAMSPDAVSVPGSFLVENNDVLYVPSRSLAVGVYGMVNSSANYRYTPGMKLGDYLKLAGGFTRVADRKYLYLIRADGTLLSGKRLLGQTANPGDLIFVPVDANRGAFWARLRDFAAFGLQGLSAAALVVAANK